MIRQGTGQAIRVAIPGATGRMGRALIQAVAESDDLELTAAIARSESGVLGQDAGEVAGVGQLGVSVVAKLEEAEDFDVLIDFTLPEATPLWLNFCRTHKKPMVIGTTGLPEETKQAIREASQEISIVSAPNMSVGINLVFRLIALAAKVLGGDYDIEIIEAHHRHKIDAPSGTALKMGEIVAGALGLDLRASAVFGREGRIGERRREEIGFSTIRAGDIVGEHTVLFGGEGERLEINHRASSRMTFARGALRAARWVVQQPPGLYDMKDVLGL